MIVVPVKGESKEELQQNLTRAGGVADLIEVRVDLCHNISYEELKSVLNGFDQPLLLTLRSEQQGGEFKGSRRDYLKEIAQLAELKPAYLDVEHDVFPLENLQLPPDVSVVISHHEWKGVPEDLNGLLQEMQKHPAAIYKLAVMPQDSRELFIFLDFLEKAPSNVCGIAMGEHDSFTRIAAKRLGSCWTYASLEESSATAPGQIVASILRQHYRYSKQSNETELYGLIGDPVSQSISDYTHNALLTQKEADALYIKVQTTKEGLKESIQWIRRQPFSGVSVTMPLKEAVIPLLDGLTPLAQEIEAVNTLYWQDGKLFGHNTDAKGALQAIYEEAGLIIGYRLVLLGVGGAAKALAHAAFQDGAELICVGRNKEKTEAFARRFGGTSATLDQMHEIAEEGYEILVNATPVELPVPEETILPRIVVMTMQTRPLETALTQIARKRGCLIVPGWRMFLHQAVGQWKLWKPEWDSGEVRNFLEQACLETLSK